MGKQDDLPVAGWRSLRNVPANQKSEVRGAPKPEPVPEKAVLPNTDQPRPAFSRPAFSRPRRQVLAAPENEIVIQMPPNIPALPGASVISILLPVLGSAMGIVISVIASQSMSSSGAVPIYVFVSAPMLLFSIGGGLYNYFQGKRKYKAEYSAKEKKYTEYIKEVQGKLDELARQQYQASITPNPPPNICLQRVADRDLRLWERRPSDQDFLTLRLGIGELPPSFKIKSELDQVAVARAPDELFDRLLVQASNLAKRYDSIAGLSVSLTLPEVVTASLIGNRAQVLDLARAMLLQIATHHSPDEVKCVLVYSEPEASQWEWARWLPHVWDNEHQSRYIASNQESTKKLLSYFEEVLKQRLNLLSNRSDKSVQPLPRYIFVLTNPERLWVGPEKAVYESFLRTIEQNGAALGAYAIFLANRREWVRQSCGAEIELSDQPGGSGVQAILRTKSCAADKTLTFAPDKIDCATADKFGRSMAPLRLDSQADELPSVVRMFELMGIQKIEEWDIYQHWTESEPSNSLKVPVGIRMGGKPLFLDLHEKQHGPHGLVAGMTRSGKTAFLSSFLAILAANYHPHEVSFIAIDYKGGDLFRDLEGLPHLIGTITNLESHLTERAIKMLDGELERRQHLFNKAKVGNIYDYQRLQKAGKAPEPLPHLIIVSDEFYELKQEQPDFIQQLVRVATVGGSLGIHLILATQRPAGVVNDQIWSNSRFHLCLKVASTQDSQEMLKHPDAASITKQGRAYFQVGMDEVFEMFQAAWGGAVYNPNKQASAFTTSIAAVELNGKRSRSAIVSSAGPTDQEQTKKEIQVLVEAIQDTAEKHAILPLSDIWLPPLPEAVYLEKLRSKAQSWDSKPGLRSSARKLEPILGLLDDPKNHRQYPLRIDLVRDNHLVIYGSAGSGKTTCLQTLITSLVLDHSPKEISLYLVDYGTGKLKVFENLPQVGAVITQDEPERLSRLVRLIDEEIGERKKAVEQCGSLASYNAQAAEPLPEMMVILDNYSGFAESIKNQIHQPEFDLLVRLASQGGNLGIHLIITSDNVNSFPKKLSNNMQASVALEMVDISDYSAAVGKTDLTVPKGCLGRGIVKAAPPLEFQSALPVKGIHDGERITALKALIQSISAAWNGPKARPVPPLPDIVTLSSLAPARTAWPSGIIQNFGVTLGVDLNSPELTPVIFDLEEGPHFWVSGTAFSGKSSFLQTWLLALADQYPSDRLNFYLVDSGSGYLDSLKGLPHTVRCITNNVEMKSASLPDEIDPLLNRAREQLQQNPASKSGLVLVVDGFNVFKQCLTESRRDWLLGLLRQKGSGFHFIAAGTPFDFQSGNNPIADALKQSQMGVFFGNNNSQGDLSADFNIKLKPEDFKRVLMPGSAFFVQKMRYRVVQLAICQSGEPSVEDWVNQIKQRVTGSIQQSKGVI